MEVQWSSLFACDSETVGKEVKAAAGVYRLLRRGPDGKFRTFYVGISDDMRARIQGHFGEAEPNRCVKSILKLGDCRFKFVYLESEMERRGAERYLCDNLAGLCNQGKPDAEPVEINLS